MFNNVLCPLQADIQTEREKDGYRDMQTHMLRDRQRDR